MNQIKVHTSADFQQLKQKELKIVHNTGYEMNRL